ncbi:MAG: sterol desaturase family protein [Pseudomonadota bacterium]|nr:sterol desaturase family protein [Pseudomonadota bacterium]
MDLIVYAIPVFLLLILVEFSYGLLCARNTYRLNDTINSLSMGTLSRLQALVVVGTSAGLYEVVATMFRLAQLSGQSLWTWLFCFVLYDLAYYWKHRWGHEVALFWGAHVAHHQSEDFNLGTALRQTSTDFYSFIFYLPFFAAGFPGEVLFSVVSLNLIYQFWVHTEHIQKLGPLEWLLVTPSNHRVHHGRNEQYIDRNYGGVFIIWDRLFGTFQDELAEDPVIFGLSKPLKSWNPLWANGHVYWRLVLDCWHTPGLANKLVLPLRRPGWRAPGYPSTCQSKRIHPTKVEKFNPHINSFGRIYVFGQFLVTTGLALYTIINAPGWGYQKTVWIVGFLTYSLCAHGFWLEGRPYSVLHELLRLGGAILLLPLIQLTAGYQLVYSGYLIGSLTLLWVGMRNVGQSGIVTHTSLYP